MQYSEMKPDNYRAPKANIIRFAGESVLCTSVTPITYYEPVDLGVDEF